MLSIEIHSFILLFLLLFRCLTYGLPCESDHNQSDDKKEKFDEKEYKRYEDIRSKMNMIVDDAVEILKGTIQLASPEEVFNNVYLFKRMLLCVFLYFVFVSTF